MARNKEVLCLFLIYYRVCLFSGHISLDCQQRRFLYLVNAGFDLPFLGGVAVDWSSEESSSSSRRDEWAADVFENRT